MQTADSRASARPLLEAMRNLTESHREHEKYYSAAPREEAVTPMPPPAASGWRTR